MCRKMLEKSCRPPPSSTTTRYSCSTREPTGTGLAHCSAAAMASPRSLSIRELPKPPSYSRDAGTPSITPGQGLLVWELQHAAVELLKMSERSFGSSPRRRPMARPSEMPAIWIASTRLLHSLAAWPLPDGPQWTTRFPMTASTGSAAAMASCLPPHMKVSVPAAAPATPPDTGASIMRGARKRVSEATSAWSGAPCAEAATTRAVPGSMVEQSISSGLRTPPGAANTPRPWRPCFPVR
mmetsp:Transcript_42774/g.108194  ORF Transcript_42774/g.108194 Transcript_42774/m.108194 type:complete len:239 (+) Transcript_42774:234-950(+)